MIEEFNIEIGTPGIRKALNKYDTESSIAELVWNGFDAGAVALGSAITAVIGGVGYLIKRKVGGAESEARRLRGQ